jgi:hypothetical protein
LVIPDPFTVSSFAKLYCPSVHHHRSVKNGSMKSKHTILRSLMVLRP